MFKDVRETKHLCQRRVAAIPSSARASQDWAALLGSGAEQSGGVEIAGVFQEASNINNTTLEADVTTDVELHT